MYDSKYLIVGGLIVILYLLGIFLPPTRFKTFLFATKYGPVQANGEPRSHYALRRSFYALKWTLLAVLIFFLAVFLMGSVQDNAKLYILFLTIMSVFSFLSLLAAGGVVFCLLGALGYWVLDWWRN